MIAHERGHAAVFIKSVIPILRPIYEGYIRDATPFASPEELRNAVWNDLQNKKSMFQTQSNVSEDEATKGYFNSVMTAPDSGLGGIRIGDTRYEFRWTK
jgi:hypothetical protein